MSRSRRSWAELALSVWLLCTAILAFGTFAVAAPQDLAPPQDSEPVGSKPPTDEGDQAGTDGTKGDDSSSSSTKLDRSIIDRINALFSQDEEPGGPINTDRPTFTPANTVVPWGRLQVETGFTFNSMSSGTSRTYTYDFPEMGVRIGIFNRVEFRTFWTGQTYASTQTRPGGPWSSINGPSDMEVGFKWQLFAGDKKRKWLPTTALITSIMAPTGGTSPYSSQTVEPYINLIYGWSVTDKLTFAGSTGYLGIRQQAAPGSGEKADSYQRFHQSLVAFYAATDRTTLFYEWYIFTFTNATDNRPQNFMDAGMLYRLSTNMQVDLRAGLGLSGRPDDFFTGAGFSVRF
jgi:Putative MetA-pathway of phenol degradation